MCFAVYESAIHSWIYITSQEDDFTPNLELCVKNKKKILYLYSHESVSSISDGSDYGATSGSHFDLMIPPEGEYKYQKIHKPDFVDYKLVKTKNHNYPFEPKELFELESLKDAPSFFISKDKSQSTPSSSQSQTSSKQQGQISSISLQSIAPKIKKEISKKIIYKKKLTQEEMRQIVKKCFL